MFRFVIQSHPLFSRFISAGGDANFIGSRFDSVSSSLPSQERGDTCGRRAV